MPRSPRTTAAEWTIVHQHREQPINSDTYEGAFLGVDGDRWMTGRMFTGHSMDDGIDAHGQWWYTRYFDDPAKPGTLHMRRALAAYIELAKKAGVWGGYPFEERAARAVDRYLAQRVPLDGVPDMQAGYYSTATQMPAGSTGLLPAVEAKYELLRYLRYTQATARLDLALPGMTLDEAYELVINATGPVRFQLGYATYWLSDTGTRREPPRNRGRRDVP